jgi:hypothetical protein
MFSVVALAQGVIGRAFSATGSSYGWRKRHRAEAVAAFPFHFLGSSQSTPSITLVVFLVFGSYMNIPLLVIVRIGTRSLSAT